MTQALTPFEQFETLLHTVLMRIFERRQADAALFRLMATHLHARLLIAEGVGAVVEPVRELLASHSKVQQDSFEQLDSEYSRDTLIVAITLFDSFLTDLARFLFLQRPQALPKDRQVRVAEIFEAGSYERIITDIVDRYAHELAFKSTRDRVQALADKFGFDITHIAGQLDELQKMADLRNELVHTTSRFQYAAGEKIGSVAVQSRAVHAVPHDAAEKSIDTSLKVISSLAEIIVLRSLASHQRSQHTSRSTVLNGAAMRPNRAFGVGEIWGLTP